MHVPIGVPNTLDTLKTFVEAEGNFSPGFGSFGVYWWVYDRDAKKLYAPTMEGMKVETGLKDGLLIPWAKWAAGDVAVKTEVCHVGPNRSPSSGHLVAARATLTNGGTTPAKLYVYLALRPVGPAGNAVHKLEIEGGEMRVDGRSALATANFGTQGVLGTDTIGDFARNGEMPDAKAAESKTGDCSGAFRFEVTLRPGESQTLDAVCPVLAGRRAVGHQWDPKGPNNFRDVSVLNPAEGGQPQPDDQRSCLSVVPVDSAFETAERDARAFADRVKITTPDPRWAEAFRAIVMHVGLCLNEGQPDVSVINYATFNRDGVYNVNILEKAGVFDLATEAIDYFLKHPFNGRPYPEADNPGQVLWIIGEHWKFTRDKAWLGRVYPSAMKLAAMIRYYRTTPGPHWVHMDSLDFGDALPKEKRQPFVLGKCDGNNPAYTEAFDLAGMRAAALLAEAMGKGDEAAEWRKLADVLFAEYDRKFGAKLPAGYGSYSVQWPCRLYPLNEGKGFEQFKGVGLRKPGGWRYFPLATAHQGLYAGNREAGHGTIAAHLDHEQMKAFYAFDEGGDSNDSGWGKVRTRWNPKIAMPHGWAISEMFLLLRDSLAFEDEGKIVLLAGVPEEWLRGEKPVRVRSMPTWYGTIGFDYVPSGRAATLTLEGNPPAGWLVRWPAARPAKFSIGGKSIEPARNGDVAVPVGTKEVRVEW